MIAERAIPNNSLHDVVRYTVLSDGQAVDPSLEFLSIAVQKEVNRLPLAKLVIRDGDAPRSDFETSNSDAFLPGKKLTIKAGLDGNETKIFEGLVVKHSIKVREQGNSDLIIECRDASVRMTLGRKSRYFEDKKDSEVLEELIGAYPGLSADVQETPVKHKELIQHHCSDWDFMLTRAEANGRVVVVDDGKVQVLKPESAGSPVLELQFGRGEMLEMEAEMDARTQLQSVQAQAWDYAGQRLFETNSSSTPFRDHGNVAGSDLANALNPPQLVMRHSGHVVEQELSEWAQGIMTRSRLSKIRGRAKFSGFPNLKPGMMVELKGVGARFNGKAFVSSVRQEMYAGSWDTHVQFGLSNDSFHRSQDVYEAPAGGLLPPIHGLQIGKVVKLGGDPDGENRIQVRIPMIDNNAPGIWTRIASLDAGNDRGQFFLPEIDDEVIVGFVNDDPRDAVVLGMLHSSAKPAPIQAADDNHEKGYTSRSKMHLYFNDQTKTIKLDTPAGNSIVIDEQSLSIKITDQNQNTITMNPQGIELKSPLNINIQAGAMLSLSAGTVLTIGATAVSVDAKGTMNLNSAISNIAAKGINNITGAVVKIN